jgi:transcriptional regulator with XRE-family HTH domain
MAEIIGIFPQWGQTPEPLWREVLGHRLRTLRADRDETLAQTAERAGISPQYLSEIERGRKEPSSEMIAALAGALDTTLADLTLAVTEDLRRLSRVRAGGRAAISRAAVSRAAISRAAVSRAAVSRAAVSRAAISRVGADLGHPAATRMPAPPVALAMAA